LFSAEKFSSKPECPTILRLGPTPKRSVDVVNGLFVEVEYKEVFRNYALPLCCFATGRYSAGFL
jgi:hypothetical protein